MSDPALGECPACKSVVRLDATLCPTCRTKMVLNPNGELAKKPSCLWGCAQLVAVALFFFIAIAVITEGSKAFDPLPL